MSYHYDYQPLLSSTSKLPLEIRSKSKSFVLLVAENVSFVGGRTCVASHSVRMSLKTLCVKPNDHVEGFDRKQNRQL